MTYSSFIARRYIRSGRKGGFLSFITFIAIIGIALGVATLIITLSVLAGFEREITDKVIGFTSHIQVTGFQNQALLHYDENIRMIRDSIPSLASIAPFAAREGLIRSRDGIDGILLKGIDPSEETGGVRRYIVKGVYQLDREKGAPPNLVIGKKLAAKLSLAIGDKATIFSIGQSVEQGQARVMQFVVSGIYESGMAEYDDVYAFTALSDAQQLFQLGSGVSGYEVMLTSADSIGAVARRLQDLLRYPHHVRTMYETYRNLFSWIALQKEYVPIILFAVTLVATINIIGTILMMVLDKTREIGILMSMGATRRGITRLFMRQAPWIAVLGTVAGNALGYALCFAQKELHFFSLQSDVYFMSTVPILMSPLHLLLVSAVSIVLCMMCAYLPSWLASRLVPVNALRFG